MFVIFILFRWSQRNENKKKKFNQKTLSNLPRHRKLPCKFQTLKPHTCSHICDEITTQCFDFTSFWILNEPFQPTLTLSFRPIELNLLEATAKQSAAWREVKNDEKFVVDSSHRQKEWKRKNFSLFPPISTPTDRNNSGGRMLLTSKAWGARAAVSWKLDPVSVNATSKRELVVRFLTFFGGGVAVLAAWEKLNNLLRKKKSNKHFCAVEFSHVFYAVLFDVVSFHVVAFCTVKSAMVLQLENFIHDIQIVEKVFPLVVLLSPLTLWLWDEVTFSMFILFSLPHTTTQHRRVMFGFSILSLLRFLPISGCYAVYCVGGSMWHWRLTAVFWVKLETILCAVCCRAPNWSRKDWNLMNFRPQHPKDCSEKDEPN